MNVKDVENAGYKVDITHFRRYEEVVMGSNGRPKIVVVERPNQKGRVCRALPRGGRTEVVITDKDGETSTAVAVCGEKDMFQKSMGVKIALGRLFGGKSPKKPCVLSEGGIELPLPQPPSVTITIEHFG